MELFFNTANPFMILMIILLMSAIIVVSRKAKIAWPLILVMIGITGYLVYHTVALDGMEKGSTQISELYHCIAFDLIYMLIGFIAFLWVDDLVAKKKKLKSYDDSLSWFWNKI